MKENILLTQILGLPIGTTSTDELITENSCLVEIQDKPYISCCTDCFDTKYTEFIKNQNDDTILLHPDCLNTQINSLKEFVYKYDDTKILDTYEAQIIDTDISFNDINYLLTDIVLELPALEENIEVMNEQCSGRCK